VILVVNASGGDYRRWVSEQPADVLRPLTARQEKLWRSITRLLVVLPRAIDEDLIARTGITLTSYLVLMQLSEAPDRRLRMSELADRAALSPSRITRVVQGLADGGLVRRVHDSNDQRAWLATLTDSGLATLQEAWPSHLAGVRALALDHIRRDEISGLGAVVDRILAAIESRD
jgi:DNA-binding MarR family transcriptional regulator